MNEESPRAVSGLHHVSAICGDPQENLDFYAGFLGLRLVKKTVNFDDPGSYHLYFGDEVGSPGTLMTFFAWIGQSPLADGRGRSGTGQIATTSFRVPSGSIGFWVDRLAAAGVDFTGPERRMDEDVLSFSDPTGLELELVARDGVACRGGWSAGPVADEHAVCGVEGVSLRLMGYEGTADLLTRILGFRSVGEEGGRYRFRLGAGADEATLDLLVQPQGPPGRMGIGAVHHVAWRVPTREMQEEIRATLIAADYDVTPVLDRQYFTSIYFREPGGVIFEIATDGPGFTVDESAAALGSTLKLPPWLEPRRERIEARLPELRGPRPGSRGRA